MWGDYGTILTGGLAKRDEQSGLLHLERVGPFAPPIMLGYGPTGRISLVTQAFREKLVAANFGGLDFKPTIKKHIVYLRWEKWDRQQRYPFEDPPGGEPENYITEAEHSEKASSEMGEIWELTVPVLATCRVARKERYRLSLYQPQTRWYLTRPEENHGGLFRPPGNSHHLFIDETRRAWFEREAEGWVEFEDVVVI